MTSEYTQSKASNRRVYLLCIFLILLAAPLLYFVPTSNSQAVIFCPDSLRKQGCWVPVSGTPADCPPNYYLVGRERANLIFRCQELAARLPGKAQNLLLDTCELLFVGAKHC